MQSHRFLPQIVAAIDAAAERAHSQDPDHRAMVTAQIVRMTGARVISPLLARDYMERDNLDD